MDISLEQAEKLIVGLPPLAIIIETITIVEDELGVIDNEIGDLLTRRELVCGSIVNDLTYVADEIDKILGPSKDEENR